MKEFSKMELAGSLAVPIMTFLWGMLYIDRLSWGVEFFSDVAYPLAIVLGGALPIFLTLKYKIHTEDYLKKRLIFIIVIFIIFSLIGSGFLKIMWRFFIYILVGVGTIIFEVFKVQEEYTTSGERAVLILSDPIVYWTVDNLISCFIEIVELGPTLEHYGWF